MPETVPLSTEPLASSSPPKRAKTKPGSSRTAKKTDGTLSEKILKVVGSSKERKGLSVVALKKALAADGYDVHHNTTRFKAGVKRLVVSEKLVQTKGTGATGSLKLNKDKIAEVNKSAKVKSAKVKSTRVKSTSPRKVAKTQTKAKAAKKTTKKPVVKRTGRKISPKKAQKSPATSSKQSRKTSVKVKKSVKKGKTKALKPKSKPATKGLKKKKATLKK